MPTLPIPDDPVPALKARVAREVVALLDGWSQWNAAVLLRGHQSTISKLRRGQLDRFSLEQLIRYLHVLGREVQVVTRRRDNDRGLLDHGRVDGPGRARRRTAPR